MLISSNIYLKGKTENNLATNTTSNEKQLADISQINNSINIKSIPNYRESRVKIEIPTQSNSKDVWEKEIFTIEDSRNRQYGDGPLYNQLVEKKYTTDPIKILLVGDSFSTGEFHNLSENTYPKILENELNKEYPGLYKVTVLGDSMSSFLHQSELLTKKLLHQLEPDLVILTYTAGRLMPNYNEAKYCREFNTCLKENESNKIATALAHDYDNSNPKWRIIMCLKNDKTIISSLFRKVLYPYYSNLAEFLAKEYCTEERIHSGFNIPTGRAANLYSSPEQSPYYNDFLQYLESSSLVIGQYNKERDESGKRLASKYMVNLSWRTEHLYPEFTFKGRKFKSISGPLISKYKEYGFTEIPTPVTREMIGNKKTWEVGSIQGSDGIDAGECYYNCEIKPSQMRKNITNFINGVINHPLKFRPGITIQKAHAEDIKREILKNHPGISISDPENNNIIDDYAPWFISYKKIDDNNFVYGYSDTIAVQIKNNDDKTFKSLKNTYCGRINHPYTTFSINNSFFKEGDNLKIGYSEGEIEDMIVVVERSKGNGERFLSEAYLLKNKEAVSIKYEKEITSIYLGDYNVVCTDPSSSLKPFLSTISKF